MIYGTNKLKKKALPVDKLIWGKDGDDGHECELEELCFQSENEQALCDQAKVSTAVLLRTLLPSQSLI